MSEEQKKMKITPKVADVDRTPVAQDIWCFNKKQGTYTWHVVVNHDAKGFVDRVQDKMTGAIYKYKRQSLSAATKVPSSVPKTARRAPTTAAAKSEALEESWFKGVRNWGDKTVTTYAPDKPFTQGAVLEHSIFGKGVVQGRRENKIDVLFRDGMKVLQSIPKK